MKSNVLFALSFFLLIAACEGPQQPALKAMLVERFDVPECSEIEPLRMAGEAVEAGHKVSREYDADAGCLMAIEKAALALDFEETAAGVLTANRENGWTETIKIDRGASGSLANVVWEEINP